MEVVNCFYNKYSVNILAIILALLIVLIFNSIVNMFNNELSNDTKNNEYNMQNNDLRNNRDITNNLEINTEEKWYLEIEKIELIAEISEGTDEETLNYFIGHFSNTPVKIGNVGLAAHNRGYINNYFSRLKELEKGDKINYYINGNKFEYEVENILIIYESDWSMLENTNDNRITMITCVENREKYRLCVQAVRVKEE